LGSIRSIDTIIVGVQNINEAIELWVNQFGLDIVSEREGIDGDLSRLWQLEDDEITKQALLATPKIDVGKIHLVQFKNPSTAVRQNANATDLGPKNLDVTCLDLPSKYDELIKMGYQFRSEYVGYKIESIGADVLEVQMPGHDHTNIIFVEQLGEKIQLSKRGYGGITSLVTIVSELDEETDFFMDILSLKEALSEDLFGEHVEKMIGLPKGGGLRLNLLEGDELDRYGRVELVAYIGAEKQDDLYKIANPPALGTLHCVFRVEDIDNIKNKLRKRSVSFKEHGLLDLIYGKGEIISFRSPAGLRIEVQQL
jgi:catechol 2,3-dioxygenase-like lactoylglutathione lyase family enzyme